MSDQPIIKRVQPIRDADGSFCPEEVVDRVVDLFVVRERDGRVVERQLGIRRQLFERALRYAIIRDRDPQGPKAMGRARRAQLFLTTRRTA